MSFLLWLVCVCMGVCAERVCYFSSIDFVYLLWSFAMYAIYGGVCCCCCRFRRHRPPAPIHIHYEHVQIVPTLLVRRVCVCLCCVYVVASKSSSDNSFGSFYELVTVVHRHICSIMSRTLMANQYIYFLAHIYTCLCVSVCVEHSYVCRGTLFEHRIEQCTSVGM